MIALGDIKHAVGTRQRPGRGAMRIFQSSSRGCRGCRGCGSAAGTSTYVVVGAYDTSV